MYFLLNCPTHYIILLIYFTSAGCFFSFFCNFLYVLYLFLQWKSRDEIVFFDELPRWNVDTSYLSPGKRSSSSLGTHPSSKLLLGGSSSGSALGGEGSCDDVSINAFGELDSLLGRAYELSLQLPTTTKRLSHTAGFLPPEHCFNEESAKDVLELEALNIVNFQTSILQIRKGVSVFKVTQDARCKPYEDQAQAYLKDMNSADRAGATASTAAASSPAASPCVADAAAASAPAASAPVASPSAASPPAADAQEVVSFVFIIIVCQSLNLPR
jgi:hypothetical protein